MHYLVQCCKTTFEGTSGLGEIGRSIPRCSRDTGAVLGTAKDMIKLMIYYRVMIKVNVAEAKLRLSSCLDRVQQGETVIICRRNVPIAELRPIPQSPAVQRPIGIDRGMKVPDTFFEPLPDDVIDTFEGASETK